MKSLLSIIAFLILTNTIAAQTFLSQIKPLGQKEWGYVNQKGSIVITPQYRNCNAFAENGYALIYESKEYFFINSKGEKLNTEIEGYKPIQKWGSSQGFHNGRVAVYKDKKWGYLDSKGKLIIALKYDKANIFEDDYTVVKFGSKFIILHKDGGETAVAIDDISNMKNFSEGLALFINKEKKRGFIDTDGNIAIEAKFLGVGNFHGGLAWAKTEGDKVGYINKKGEWVIEPKFTAAKDFDPESGMARVRIVNQWAYVNQKGEIFSWFFSETYHDFHNGFAKGKKLGKIGYYNNKGKWIISPSLEGGRNFHNGFVAAKKGGKWGFMDAKGNWVVEPQFAGIKDLEKVD